MGIKKRYVCTLSEELLTEAVVNLDEPADNSVRLERIDDLHQAFKQQNPHLKLFRKDDMFFLQFLRATKFEKAKALHLLTSYHKQLQEWPAAFDQINDPDMMEPVLKKGVAFPVNGRAKNGSGVVIIRHGKGRASLLDGITMLLLALEHMLEKEENQIFGIMMIQDFSYATPKVMWQFEPQILKKFYSFMFDGLPFTLVKTIVVNEPALFSVVNAITNRVLCSTDFSKMTVVGTNYRLLDKHVDLSILPPSVGGTGPDCDAEFWKRKILSSSKRYC